MLSDPYVKILVPKSQKTQMPLINAHADLHSEA